MDRIKWILILLIFSKIVKAQEEDIHGWFALDINKDISKKTQIGYSFERRYEDKITVLRGNYHTIDGSYKLNKLLTISGNIRYATKIAENEWRNALGFSAKKKIGDFSLGGRQQILRFKKTAIDDGDITMLYETRSEIETKYKIKNVSLSLGTTFFWEIQNKDDKFNYYRNRLTASAKYDFSKRFALSLGVIRQTDLNKKNELKRLLTIPRASLIVNL